ncbi:MAG: septum formation initiator family protein [Clostridia bacterium]|nr:septum formation initiator family protein [Clostridia bacterium]
MPNVQEDIKKKTASASELTSDEILEESEKNLERAIKTGVKTPHIKVVARLLLAVLLIASLAAFVTGLMKYSELQREKAALEDKVEEYEAEVEELEYLINSPIDYEYIIRVAKEKLNLLLPDEIIYHNDSNGK